MITLFTEAPIFLVVTGMAITASLAVVYYQTQNRRLWPWMIAAGVLTLLPILTAALIETEQEQIKRRIYQMANCVRQNDVDGLLRFIDKQAVATFERFAREMPTYDFSACNVTGFQKLEIDPQDPNRAIARFAVFVNVSAPRYSHEGAAVRGVELQFRKLTDGRWLVTGFDHFPTDTMRRLLDSR